MSLLGCDDIFIGADILLCVGQSFVSFWAVFLGDFARPSLFVQFFVCVLNKIFVVVCCSARLWVYKPRRLPTFG